MRAISSLCVKVRLSAKENKTLKVLSLYASQMQWQQSLIVYRYCQLTGPQYTHTHTHIGVACCALYRCTWLILELSVVHVSLSNWSFAYGTRLCLRVMWVCWPHITCTTCPSLFQETPNSSLKVAGIVILIL